MHICPSCEGPCGCEAGEAVDTDNDDYCELLEAACECECVYEEEGEDDED
jgi:hypothetical protein